MQAKVFGKFTKREGLIYRTDTYIQFGESEDIIGGCVLCNPGSSKLEDPKEETELVGFRGPEKAIEGKAVIDLTMKQLIKLLRGASDEPVEGKFYIYNLFTLKDAKMGKAIECLVNPINEDLLYKDYDDFNKKKSDLPFIILGWGCEDRKVLNDLKRQWLHSLKDDEYRCTGYKHKKSPHYYHPLPQIKIKQEEYIEKMIPKVEKVMLSRNY